MKYKTNQRILQITESTLVVGADIAKKTHIARAMDFRGVELGKPCTFENTRHGLMSLLHWLNTLKDLHDKSNVLFGLEPTGHYWMPLAQFLRTHGIKVVLVNPHHVKKSKELDDNSPTKNDKKDAAVIARLIKDGRYTEPHFPTDIYAELRVVMVQRDQLNGDLNRVKGRIHNWLDRFFPEYIQVFKDWEGKASLLTLKKFPLPQDVADMSADEIVSVWKTEVKRAVGRKRAESLIWHAKQSIGLTEGIESARLELKFLLEQYEMLCRQMEDLMQRIQQLLEQIPGAKEMMTVPGVGWVTVAGFLAEVGDLSSYEDGRQIIRLAGLNLKENSSGKHKGKTRITKRGRPRLRSLLFKCAMVLVAKNEQLKSLHQYLTTRPQNPLKKKQSIIAICGKIARILFCLGRKRLSYDAQKVLGSIQQKSLQNAA